MTAQPRTPASQPASAQARRFWRLYQLWLLVVFATGVLGRFVTTPHPPLLEVLAVQATAVLVFLIPLVVALRWLWRLPLRQHLLFTMSLLAFFLGISYFPVTIGVHGPVADDGFWVAMGLIGLSCVLIVPAFFMVGDPEGHRPPDEEGTRTAV